MLRCSLALIGLLGIAAAAALTGCNQGPTADAPAAGTSPAGSTNHAGTDVGVHADHHHGEHAHDGMEKMEAGLAKLSAADRAAAMKQHVCPVSGEMLGTMGTPVKVSVNDRDVWICCENCRDPLTSDPDKFLAKLDDVEHDHHAGHSQ